MLLSLNIEWRKRKGENAVIPKRLPFKDLYKRENAKKHEGLSLLYLLTIADNFATIIPDKFYEYFVTNYNFLTS